MRRLLPVLLISSVLCQGKIGITQVAAATTITVNILEIKSNIQKVRKAARAVKRTARKVVKHGSK